MEEWSMTRSLEYSTQTIKVANPLPAPSLRYPTLGTYLETNGPYQWLL
jgi:hypothetical protein